MNALPLSDEVSLRQLRAHLVKLTERDTAHDTKDYSRGHGPGLARCLATDATRDAEAWLAAFDRATENKFK